MHSARAIKSGNLTADNSGDTILNSREELQGRTTEQQGGSGLEMSVLEAGSTGLQNFGFNPVNLEKSCLHCCIVLIL